MISQLWVSPYTLVFLAAPNSQSPALKKEGLLLKIRFAEGYTGYGCLQTWESLGEPSLSFLLRDLQRPSPTHKVCRRILELTQKDGQARKAQKSLWAGVRGLANHWTLTDLAHWCSVSQQIEACGMVKIKVGGEASFEKDKIAEIQRAYPRLKLRLDFNGMGAEPLMALLTDQALDAIDFVEDPGPFENKFYEMWHKRGWPPLARDRAPGTEVEGPSCFQVKVVRPLQEDFLANDVKDFHLLRKVAVSNMDHPFGQMVGYCEASESQGFLDPRAGFLTHLLQAPTRFHPQMVHEDSRILSPQGFGFGFDDLLEKESWQLIS